MDASTGRTTNKLTDRACRAFAAKARAGKKLSDGGAMFLTLTASGTAVWRLKFRVEGKERLYSIGVFPDVGLEAARAERDRAKALIRAGRDPVNDRERKRVETITASGNTFEAVTADWLSDRRKEWSEVHYRKSSQALERDVLPTLGKLAVADITPAMLAAVIRNVLNRGSRDAAAKVRWLCLGIFRLAQANGLRNDNPAEAAVVILGKKKRPKHMPAVTDFDGLGNILRDVAKAPLTDIVQMAHRLTAFTVARISNIVEAEWREFDLDANPPTWIIPRSKMKAKDRDFDFKVILSVPIVNELRAWRKVVGSRGYLFPGRTGGEHVSREAIEKAYRTTVGLADKHSPHSWRSAFSTRAREQGHEREVIELCLDHVHDNEVALAYDRGTRLQKRAGVMNWWGTHLMIAQFGSDLLKQKA